MSLDNLLDHLCDIYHVQKTQKDRGYGLPPASTFSYRKEPDIPAQICHFNVKSRTVTIAQTAPANLMDARIKLVLPIGTDVRRNDRIVDCKTGLEYTAEQPINVRNHHMFVYLKKTEGQKAL